MGQEPFHERDKAKIKKHCPPEHDGKRNGTGPMHMTFSQDPDDNPLDPAMRHKDPMAFDKNSTPIVPRIPLK